MITAVQVEVGCISPSELSSLVTLVRVQGAIELNCGLTQTEVSNSFRHLIEKVRRVMNRKQELHLALRKLGPHKGYEDYYHSYLNDPR